MSKRVRCSIPRRCNATALYFAPNGYCLCREHWNLPTERQDVVWQDLREFGPLVDRCDYPMDGLGAARYER
jgi:hypothetical protein